MFNTRGRPIVPLEASSSESEVVIRNIAASYIQTGLGQVIF